MKQYLLYLLIFLPLAASAQYRVDGLDGSVRVTTVALEEKGDSLEISLRITVEGSAVNRRQSHAITPVLAAGDSTVVLPYVLLCGKIKQQHYRRQERFGNTRLTGNRPCQTAEVPAGSRKVIDYQITLPYRLWMDEARLDIHKLLVSPAKTKQLFTIENIARVTLQPREPYALQPKVSFVEPEREQKSRNMQGQAFLDFASGRSVIVPTFRRNPEELAKIEAAIRKVQNDPDVTINSLFIEGYASPEGSYTSNDRLARERSEALSDYISQNYGVPASIIRTSSVAEDWDGLRVLVEESSIARRDDILTIIDGTDDPDRKEQRLRALGIPWQTMLNTMFPQLRRVEYQVDFTVKDYSLEESRNLAARNPEMLSQRELYLLAQSYEEGTPDWERTLETIIRLYPDDPTAINNYAGLLLMRGELTSAKRYLDRIADTPEAANNLGVYYLLTDDLHTAETYLIRAQTNGVAEAVKNLEELRIKREDNIRMERYNK